ncbi:hypothetical protein F4777DRAFT_216764 [Nemania sp. FL0916]|nr:hypothetical protein F4777DRAFT_216764 [Nemania sp. FL0916]
MGFTTGFTGGVTLTLGVVYLSLLAHRRHREQQAAILRQQTYLVSGTFDPLPPTLPPTRAEIAAIERANFTDSLKDRWNAEVEDTVRRMQSQDWVEVRENLEAAAMRMWDRAVGKVENGAENSSRDVAKEAREKSEGVAAAAKSAYASAREKAQSAKNSVIGALGTGVEKGKQAVSDVKSEATLSPVEKALQQRYEKTNNNLERTPEEVLAARYAPADQKENTNLRGL